VSDDGSFGAKSRLASQIEDVETDGEKGGAQQITDGRQVWYA